MNRSQEYVVRALHEVPLLTDAECRRIAALGLPVYESLVLGHLKAAAELLDRDALFNTELREEAWHRWLNQVSGALEGALRYHENDALVIAFGAVVALYPLMYPRAMLTGFKILEDAVAVALRGRNVNPRRGRRRKPFRVQDVITRIAVWRHADGRLALAGQGTAHDASRLQAQGFEQVSGVHLHYDRVSEVLPLITALIPVLALPLESGAAVTVPA